MTEEITTEKIDWVEKAIEYEATPERLREPKTTTEFAKILGIPRSSYYYEMSKKENQERIIDICFKQAKKRTPNILDKLGQKAEEGDGKSQEMFLDYVLEKSKKTETKLTGGLTLTQLLTQADESDRENKGV